MGEAISLILSVGITAWSINSYEKEKPEIESKFRQALNTGLDSMWKRLVGNSNLSVLFPVNHMHHQIESELFPIDETEVVVPF